MILEDSKDKKGAFFKKKKRWLSFMLVSYEDIKSKMKDKGEDRREVNLNGGTGGKRAT